MRKTNSWSVYDRLTPEEHLRLVLEAAARQDEPELERLADTCPRLRLTTTRSGPAFTDRVRTSRQITTCVVLLLAEVLAKLTVIRTVQECVAFLSRSLVTEFDRGYLRGWEAGCDHAWQSAGMADPFPWRNSSDPGQETEEVAGALASEGRPADGNELEAMAEALTTEVGTLWEEFSRFCRAEIGAEPEMLLRAWLPPTGNWTEDALNAVDGVRVDADALLEYETALTKAWREFLGA